MRLFWIFVFFAALVLIPFLIWGDDFEAWFSQEAAVEWLRGFGPWAWAAGLGLLIADLFLPIPGTAVMAALGFVYGTIWGGLLGATGSILAGILAYGLCRRLGRPAAEWIAGREDLEKGERIFGSEAGGFIVALSRWLPIMPEVVACMAGMSQMPFGRFLGALACGSVPLGFAFAAIGSMGQDRPGFALLLSALIPPVLWLLIRPLVVRRSRAASKS